MSDELQLSLLGKPQVTLGGAPVTGFVYRKSLALLIYLAVTGRPHSRDTLIGLLWPEATEPNARSSLRKTLTALRRHVAPFLAITRHEVAFNPATPYWLDVEAFEAGVADASGSGIERLQQAVEAYRGDFLEGFYVRQAPAFEEWALAQRARLRERALQALYTLARHYGAQGASGRATAVDYTTRLLPLEPWREEAHRQLMQLLALSGQRGAALAHYETCRQMLADELGVEPGPETMRLYEQIRDGGFPPERASSAQERQRPAPVPLRTLLSPEDLPEPDRPVFVARERALAQLDQCLDAALDGQGHVFFVTGGPGRGKTTLMREFAVRALAAHPDLLVAFGNCNAYSGVGDPYLPFREVLGALTGDIAGALSREHARRLLAALPLTGQALLDHGPYLINTLVPGPTLLDRVKTAVGDGRWVDELTAWVERDPTEGAGLEQSALLAQATNTLIALAARHPLLLVLDDLQWADPGSVSLLFHLGRHLADAGGRLLVVGAYRPEEISIPQHIDRRTDGIEKQPGRHPLEQVLAEFKRHLGDVWTDLAQLEQTENRRFVDAVVDAEPNHLDEVFRATLHQRTAGHPLFTIELLRAMKERGDLFQEGDAWMAVPDLDWNRLPAQVEAVIEGRVGRLDEKLYNVLAVAAVEGERFSAQVVAQVLGVSELQVLRQLNEELNNRHRLVRETSEEAVGGQIVSHYEFSHALFQKHVYDRLGSAEKKLLHNQIGTALESLYGDQTDEIAVQLAMHFADADVPTKAWTYYARAADVAARVYANAEAIVHYRRALEWAGRLDIDSLNLVHLYTGLGRAYELSSDFEQAVAVYEEMEGVAHERNDLDAELAALMAHAAIKAVPTSVRASVQAQKMGGRAIALARELGNAEAEAKILWTLSLAYFFDNSLAQAIECGEQSLALARRLDLRGQMAQTLNDLGSFCYMYSGHIEQAKPALQEATTLWRELENLPMLADSLSSSSVAHIYAGEFDRALALSEEASEISESIDNTWGRSYRLWKLGIVYAEWGEWSRALNTMQECIRLGELAGFLPSQTQTRADLAALYRELGATRLGKEMVRLALSTGESSEHLIDRGTVLAALASLHLVDGDCTAATDAIEEAKRNPYLDTWRVFGIPVRLTIAEVALAQGKNEYAAAAMEKLLVDLRPFGTRIYVPYALFLLGKALAKLGKPKDAREHLLEARDQAIAIGSRRILWRILYALSQNENDPIQAECLRIEARNVLQYIVDHIHQAELRESFLNQPDVRTVLESCRCL